MIIKSNQIIIGLLLVVIVILGVGCFLKSKDSVVNKEGIEIYNIKAGQTVKSPLLIKGAVTGGKWAPFEGQAGRVELVGSNGKVLGIAPLFITSDFMKFPVSFEANLVFSNPEEEDAFIVFYNENPSGLLEHSRNVSFLVKVPQEKVKVKLYFGMMGDDTCKNVFPVEREIKQTLGIARVTIEELLKGLTTEEKNNGYFTTINEGVQINNLTIIDGTAKIDFDETMEKGMGGSCRVSMIRQQVIKTLMQFPSVEKVIISIDGRTEDILQP